MKRKISAGYIARVGVLGAISAVLFWFPEIRIIGFYQLDFSNLPALIGGFALGPVAGVAIVLIKDIVGLTHTTSLMVGEVADFLMSGAFVLIASLWYQMNRTRRGAILGMLFGTLAMTLVGALANYYILIPFYIGTMQLPPAAIIGMMSAVIPAIDSMWKLILMATVPFNLLKGFVISLIAILLYKRLSPLLHGKKE